MTRLRGLVAVVMVGVLALCAAQAGAQDWAKAQLEKSMRHREYVTVQSGSRSINTYVVYPETKGKAPVVVLIHEIFGLSDWLKLQADEIAAKGYIVIVPDLVSGLGANGGGTDALGGQDNVIKAVMGLPPDQVMTDLDAVADYGKKLPSASGTLFVAGFCWGGGKSFAFATHRNDLNAAFVFYGPPPPAADMAKINAPIYGFYGGNDARIGATIPQAVTDMKSSGKFFEPVTYADAGHGFMRGGQDPAGKPGDKKAFDEGFVRLTKELAANTKKKAVMAARLARPASHKPVIVALAGSSSGCAGMHGL